MSALLAGEKFAYSNEIKSAAVDGKEAIKRATDLVNEGGKAVVEGLDLFLFLCADSLDVGVDFQVQRGQQALVDLDRCDRWSDHG